MNSLDDAPCAASIAPSHRRWREIGPGGEAEEALACLRLLWTHMDAGFSEHTHIHMLRKREAVCVCVCAPAMLTAHWTANDLLTGDSMELIEEVDLLC